jgi:hypothetical protein
VFKSYSVVKVRGVHTPLNYLEYGKMGKMLKQRIKTAVIIILGCALVLGLPTALISGKLMDLVIVTAWFSVPLILLQGPTVPNGWSENNEREERA